MIYVEVSWLSADLRAIRLWACRLDFGKGPVRFVPLPGPKQQHIGAEVQLRVPISQRQTELRAKALALGAKLYDEEPKDFIHRFAEYWHEWHA